MNKIKAWRERERELEELIRQKDATLERKDSEIHQRDTIISDLKHKLSQTFQFNVEQEGSCLRSCLQLDDIDMGGLNADNQPQSTEVTKLSALLTTALDQLMQRPERHSTWSSDCSDCSTTKQNS